MHVTCSLAIMIVLYSMDITDTVFFYVLNIINNSLAKHKGNHTREGLFICDKIHVDFHKTFASIFTAFTISILEILLQTS